MNLRTRVLLNVRFIYSSDMCLIDLTFDQTSRAERPVIGTNTMTSYYMYDDLYDGRCSRWWRDDDVHDYTYVWITNDLPHPKAVLSKRSWELFFINDSFRDRATSDRCQKRAGYIPNLNYTEFAFVNITSSRTHLSGPSRWKTINRVLPFVPLNLAIERNTCACVHISVAYSSSTKSTAKPRANLTLPNSEKAGSA